MDADQLFVDIWAGHRVDRKQFLTRRQALVVNVLRVEFDLNLFVQSVQVQLQTVQRVPAINTQYILPCKQLDGGHSTECKLTPVATGSPSICFCTL